MGHPPVKRMHRGRTSWDAFTHPLVSDFIAIRTCIFLPSQKIFPSRFSSSFANLPWEGTLSGNALTLKIARLRFHFKTRLRCNETFSWQMTRESFSNRDRVFFTRTKFCLENFPFFCNEYLLKIYISFRNIWNIFLFSFSKENIFRPNSTIRTNDSFFNWNECFLRSRELE